ncbi:Enoyl-CoA hydratase/isomerase [Rubrobacter xylanophilus DSM 9941]|uniref:Enoyl-CoA hydratase/isomerase n=1 Tax=Rubrobacter xylanophilus (strain DSM 9941 / JCM 11954 / NBRC 16129 / PRD-1) TaxID=266117 RepID=Q1AZF6_RUBXD|nr:enoyl-CoA hydratase/isomerase family protein [Rubrobacter xylanophilus]ABG03222.1 Enoyl-CoA hydratase/isomerase [Rubrobacter xylanophilus DSM 9941]
MRTGTEQLLYERRGARAYITFNRPEARNAMTWEMYEALYECCEEVDRDEGVRVVVLRGAGGRAFVAGTDIRQFREFESGEDGIAYERRMERVIGRLEEVGKPTVAVVDGYAVGGGLSICAVCDLRVCTPEARFGIPIARTLGNCLSMKNYARLMALVGPARTKALLFTARMFSAEEALAAGLATEVVPREELDGRVEELCSALESHAPITMRVTKEALRRITFAGLPDGSDLVRQTYGSEDFHEGVAAFVEKRSPRWRGR